MSENISSKMTVYHINGLYEGGAAIAARRLFESLKSFSQLNLTFFYAYGETWLPHYKKYTLSRKKPLLVRLRNRIPLLSTVQHKIFLEYDKYMNGRPPGLEQFSLAFSFWRTPLPRPLPDIVHLHWMGSNFDYPSFFSSIPVTIPIVWTLHDMNPFTGGCHYSNGCERFESLCKSCPQLSGYNRYDLATVNFLVKDQALKGRKIHVVGDSVWLTESAKRSALLKNAETFRCVHYGLDNEVFSPQAKAQCRSDLNIVDQGREYFVCFGADDIQNRRKGFKVLLDAVSLLHQKGLEITCLVFGRGSIPSLNEKVRICHFGSVTSEKILAQIYNAADVFVIPSLEEAFGQTCLEAMSCGTPVVAFRTGGIPDMIEDQITGLFAETGSATDLAAKIETLLLNDDLKNRISVNARKKVVEKFRLENQAQKYFELYQTVLS